MSGQRTTKSISIKDAKRRFGDSARKAAELTPVCPVSLRRLRMPRGILTAGQKSAEGVLGHVVGKASEALRRRKVEATDRLSRERWLKARTRGEASRT